MLVLAKRPRSPRHPMYVYVFRIPLAAAAPAGEKDLRSVVRTVSTPCGAEALAKARVPDLARLRGRSRFGEGPPAWKVRARFSADADQGLR